MDGAAQSQAEARQRCFLALFSRDSERLRTWIFFLLRDRHLAEDAFQETSLTLWERFDDYDPARPFLAWARGVARFKCMRLLEQRRSALPLLSAEALAAVADALDRAEAGEGDARAEALDRCLERVPAPGRRLLRLRYGEDLDLATVATRAASSLTAVTKALSRLRAQLEDCLRRVLADDGLRP